MLNIQGFRSEGYLSSVWDRNITEMKTILVLLFMSGLLTRVKRYLMNWTLRVRRPWGPISHPLYRWRNCFELFCLATAVLQQSNFCGKNGFEAWFHFEFCRTCQSGEKNCLEENVLASLFTDCNLRLMFWEQLPACLFTF